MSRDADRDDGGVLASRPRRLSGLPGNRRLVLALVLALVAAVAVQVVVQRTFLHVRHPVPLAAANLEADPAVVRDWYRLLEEQGTHLQMIRTEVVDLLWALALGAALVALFRCIGGLLRTRHPPIAALLVRLAPFAAIGPAADLVENVFSLAMLTDPTGFPDWWARAHALASWAKLAAVMVTATTGTTLTVIALLVAHRRRKAPDADPALPPP